MNTTVKAKKKKYYVSPSQKKTIDSAAKKIVKNYGKTIKLLAKE